MCTKWKTLIVLGFAVIFACGRSQGQTTDTSYLKASDSDTQWWREARFGMFIHWGPVSLKGTEIGWSRGGERRGQTGGKGEIPVDVYDNLYKELLIIFKIFYFIIHILV